LKKKKLRSGYTTGACAAAAAKAAALLLLSAEAGKRGSREGKSSYCFRTSGLQNLRSSEIEIPFPDNSRVTFRVQGAGVADQGKTAWASVIKDAGDDPDITNGAEIVAEARLVQKRGGSEARKIDVGARRAVPLQIIIEGGEGVGTVTKPGLPVPVGEPAINPVPRKMIEAAVRELLSAEVRKRGSAEAKKDLRACDLANSRAIEITISVPRGEELAKKTLNHRLGIVGGISILGTTGIVKPVSSEAWTATIASSMDVARATGLTEIVLSAGRSSERFHMKAYNLPEESYVLMGDYLEYSLREAGKHGFKKIHLCAQWAKMLKIAMATPQTHVRFGAINTGRAVRFLNSLGIEISHKRDFNTAREIYEYMNAEYPPFVKGGEGGLSPFVKVCKSAKKYAEKIAGGISVATYLVSYNGEMVTGSE
jgi:cobalt-precorrin-5B (C1)-methyltransferase